MPSDQTTAGGVPARRRPSRSNLDPAVERSELALARVALAEQRLDAQEHEIANLDGKVDRCLTLISGHVDRELQDRQSLAAGRRRTWAAFLTIFTAGAAWLAAKFGLHL